MRLFIGGGHAHEESFIKANVTLSNLHAGLYSLAYFFHESDLGISYC